jgi:hypothetical protein
MRLNSESGSVADNLPFAEVRKRRCPEDVLFTGHWLEARWFGEIGCLRDGMVKRNGVTRESGRLAGRAAPDNRDSPHVAEEIVQRNSRRASVRGRSRRRRAREAAVKPDDESGRSS